MTTTSVFIAFYTVILTPIFEEIMFRGYIQSALAALKTHFLLTNLLTTLLFLVPHCLVHIQETRCVKRSRHFW